MEHATPNGRRDGARELRGHRASGERSHRRAGPPGQPAGTPRRCLVRRRPATVRDRPRPRSGSAGADGQGGRGLAEGRRDCRRRDRARGRAAQRLGGGRRAPGGGPCRRGRGNRSSGRAASRLGGHAAAGQSRAPACRGPPRASRAAAAPEIRDRGPRGRGPHAANRCGDDRRAGANLGAGGGRRARGSSREKAGCPGNAGGDARSASRDRGRTAAVQERTRAGGGRGRPGRGHERSRRCVGGRRARCRAGPRVRARARAVQWPGGQPQYFDRRLRAKRRGGVHARRYRHLVRDGELPGDAAAPYSRGGACRSLLAIAPRAAFPRDGRRAGLGRAARERDERQWTAPCRALARLDPACRALSGAHQGRGSRRILPHRRLGGRDRAWLAQARGPVTAAAFVGFLRRELALTPGRGSATFRLTLACLIATIPILTHRIPHALIVMIVMYLITQEDTAATLLGSILAVAGVTLGLSAALLAWMVALDIAWLRIACFIAFFFVGLFLKRVLVVGALGSAIGVPAALVMILPDVAPLGPESLVEFVLWIWLCVTLGLTVNLGVQLLLAPGDPLTLLQRELDTRLRVVENTVRELAGASDVTPAAPAMSLDAVTTAGMSRPLALLKTASLVNARARERHEALAATITLVDRLVTDAGALRTLLSSAPAVPVRESLERVADGCARARHALAAQRWPESVEEAVRPGVVDLGAAELPPLADMARTLEQLAVAASVESPSRTTKEAGRRFLLPDATTNPEYLRFAVKGTLAALICYVLFIGFDYPQIYTSVITCFVVSLSTIGSSNQKGLLRFGGAAVGGVLRLCALVYAFPHIDGVGGFWLVFASGTAVAGWINFGSPRISYGGYQTGLAFYKATLQKFGPAASATVVRDRLIGVAFGLIVFGIVEYLLWPVRAADRMHARLADVCRSLAALARAASRPPDDGGDIAARRDLVGRQVTDVEGFND